MENLFFKYGVVIVGVVIVTLLMVFAYSSLSKTLVVPDEKEQEFSGTALDSKIYIEKLCEKCESSNLNRECFILDLNIEDEGIGMDEFEEVKIDRDIDQGKNIIKVSYDDGCVVRRLE